jgi:hypothetical protein
MLKGEVARMDLGTNHAEVRRGVSKEVYGRPGKWIRAILSDLLEWRSPYRRGRDEGLEMRVKAKAWAWAWAWEWEARPREGGESTFWCSVCRMRE